MTLRLLVIGVLIAVVLPTPPVAAAAPAVRRTVVQDSLVIPWDVAFTPDGRMLVTERPGRVRVYASGRKDAVLLRTRTIRRVRAEGEAGLMGIAVDRDFAHGHPYVYLCASRSDEGRWRNQVLRYRLTNANKLRFDRYVIRRGMKANRIHNGCALEFGRGRVLWVGMGDANRPHLAQKPHRLNGKILRVKPNGRVPPRNPVIAGKRTLVYSRGHRNPQGIAAEPRTRRWYAVEHGPDRDDEINRVRKGRNYGWPCVTGRDRPYQTWRKVCQGKDGSDFKQPAWTSGVPTLATSGAAFPAHRSWAGWRNDLFVATLKQQDLRRFRRGDTNRFRQRSVLLDGRYGRLRAVVRSPGGRLFVTTSNGVNDKVVRLRARR